MLERDQSKAPASPTRTRRKSWDGKTETKNSQSPRHGAHARKSWDVSSEKKRLEALRPSRLRGPLCTIFSTNESMEDSLHPAGVMPGPVPRVIRRTKSCSDFSKVEHRKLDSPAKRDLFVMLSEAFSLQLENFVATIRGDQKRSESRIEAAIRDLEQSMRMRLLEPMAMDSPYSGKEGKVRTCPNLPLSSMTLEPREKAASSTLSGISQPPEGGHACECQNGEKKSSSASHESKPFSIPGEVSATRSLPAGSDGQNTSDKLFSPASTLSSPSQCSIRLSKGQFNLPRRRSRTSNKSSNKSSNGGSLPSGLSHDAKICDIEKYQTDNLMRDSGFLQRSDGTVSTPTSHIKSDTTSLFANPDPLALQEKGEILSLTSVDREGSPESLTEFSGFDGRRTSRSLESLRQQNDSVLALSGLASDGSSCEFGDKPFSATSSRRTSGASSRSSFSATQDSQMHAQIWYNHEQGQLKMYLLPWALFRLCGVIPWCRSKISYIYSFLLLSLAIAVVMYPAIQTAQGRMSSINLCTLPCTVAGLLGTLSLRRNFILELFTDFPGPFEFYAFKHGFASEFLYGSLRHFVAVAMLWICMALVRGAGQLVTVDASSCTVDDNTWVFVCFLIGSVLFAMLLYAQLHVICMLEQMVDRYCIKLFPRPASCQSVLEWNLIQAMLRQIAGTFDICFMMTQTGAWTAVLLAGLQVFSVDFLEMDGACGLKLQLSLLVPPVLMAMGAFFVFVKAASVSEKCSRVAPLVNSMTFDDQKEILDSKRTNIVHYISSSNAGFYIQEVRITASMAIKLMYVTALGAFALFSKLATDTRNLSA